MKTGHARPATLQAALLLLLGKLVSFRNAPQTEEKRQRPRRGSEGRKRRASQRRRPLPGTFLGKSLANTEPLGSRLEALAPAEAAAAGRRRSPARASPPPRRRPQGRRPRALPPARPCPGPPALTEVVEREAALVRGPRLEALGPEVHGRRHDGGSQTLSQRAARRTQDGRPTAEQAPAGAPSTSSGEPPRIGTETPPLAPRPRPWAPTGRDPRALALRWGFLLSSRQRNGRGSSRHLFRTRKRSSERVSNLPKDTQLQSIRSQRAGGRSWKAVPGGGGGGAVSASPRGCSLGQQIPSLTVPGASHARAGCSLPAGGLPATLGAPGLWTHHSLGLTTWPLPVCLCPHSIFP